MHSTPFEFLLLAESLEESISAAEYLYCMLLSSHRLKYKAFYHAVKLFNNSIHDLDQGYVAHQFEIYHAARIRPLIRLCVRCIECPVPEDLVRCEQDKNRIECVNETMERLCTLYMEMVAGCWPIVCKEEHVTLTNGQWTPPCSFLQDAMDCLSQSDEDILVEIARLGPETAMAWDIEDDRLIHQALDQRLMKLVHEVSKWKTGNYKTNDGGQKPVDKFLW